MKLAISVLFAAVLAFGQSTTPRTAVLTWTDDKNPAGTGYNVYRLDGACPATQPQDAAAFTKKNPAPLSAKTFTEPLALGTYCYIVTATAASLESVPSATVPAVAKPFAPVVNVTVDVGVNITVNGVQVASASLSKTQ